MTCQYRSPIWTSWQKVTDVMYSTFGISPKNKTLSRSSERRLECIETTLKADPYHKDVTCGDVEFSM